MNRALPRAAIALPLALLLIPGRLLAQADPPGTITWEGWKGLPGTSFVTDVTGYVDPVSGREYAVVGDNFDGIFIVDVTDPTAPAITGTVSSVPGIDVKVHGRYAYSVSGGSAGLGGIVDLSDPGRPVRVGQFPSAHNIFIAENGYLYASRPGLRIYDLNVTPKSPVLVWTAPPSPASPRSAPPGPALPPEGPLGWLYPIPPSLGPRGPRLGNPDPTAEEGHDATVVGNVLYDFEGTRPTRIWNVADPTNPILLGTIDDPAIRFHHGGWPAAGGRHLVICDELARHPTPDLTVWNIEDPAHPFKVGEYSDPNATIHNIQILGDIGYASYYTAGFRTFTLSIPTTPTPADTYDTSFFAGEIFRGAFGVHALLPSGLVLVSDWDNGLYLFSVSSSSALPLDVPDLALLVRLGQNLPNPFNPTTTIPYELARDVEIELRIFDASGRLVRRLEQGFRRAGPHRVTWNGTSAKGGPVALGVYFCRIEADGFSDTKQMILVE